MMDREQVLGHYTTHVFVIRDAARDTEATMRTTSQARFYDADSLEGIFRDVGFDEVDWIDRGGPTTVHALE